VHSSAAVVSFVPSPQSDQSGWFAEHVQPHEAALRAFLIAQFPALTDVDDLVQDTFSRVLRAQASGPVESPRGLLFATARNLALDALRRRQVVSFEPMAENPSSPVYMDVTDVAETVSKRQELELLTEAIQALPDGCRKVFTLRAVYGLSQREIAVRLGISENTVEKQMGKGLKRCGDFFAQRGLPPR
jgi:RNA polymerase sigma-70 factor (ECF subfamily)